MFETADTLIALGQLAQYQRLRANVNIVAITGSSGKTTTRKITEEIFKTRFHTHATIGNFNNEIGLPLTLLGLSWAHEWAIVEMGMNHPGEISRLSRIALPDIAMITNTAGVHLEGLGSVENVARAKAEIFDHMRDDSTAILPADDHRLAILESAAKRNRRIKSFVFFGHPPNADISSSNIEAGNGATHFTIHHKKDKKTCSINSPASFMVNNCLAAAAAARLAGIEWKGVQQGIKAFSPESGRMNIYKLSSRIHLMDDTYNANPDSVTQALHTLRRVSKGKQSIAVLGDMLELGKNSDRLHWKIGQTVADLGPSKLYVFGEKVSHLVKGAIEHGFAPANIYHGSKSEIARKITEVADTETWVLVKGSRGMAMETVIKDLNAILTVNSVRG